MLIVVEERTQVTLQRWYGAEFGLSNKKTTILNGIYRISSKISFLSVASFTFVSAFV